MDAEAYRNKTVPSAGSLYEEAQALMFGGADTVGNTLMVGTHHLLQKPATLQKLKEELWAAWPSLEGHEPTLRELENLPYLNAVIKESLRISSGVVAGLLRIVPSTGATINGLSVPPRVRRRFIRSMTWLLTFTRPSFLAAAPSCTTMLHCSLNQRSSFQNVGLSLSI